MDWVGGDLQGAGCGLNPSLPPRCLDLRCVELGTSNPGVVRGLLPSLVMQDPLVCSGTFHGMGPLEPPPKQAGTLTRTPCSPAFSGSLGGAPGPRSTGLSRLLHAPGLQGPWRPGGPSSPPPLCDCGLKGWEK